MSMTPGSLEVMCSVLYCMLISRDGPRWQLSTRISGSKIKKTQIDILILDDATGTLKGGNLGGVTKLSQAGRDG